MHSTVYNVKGVEAIYLKFVFNFNTSTCTVQVYYVKVSKQVIIYSIYLRNMTPTITQAGLSWERGQGIEIVDEGEVDAEVQEIEEDKEVERIYNDSKEKHRQMLTGTCICSVLSKVSKVLCTEYYVFNHTDTCCLMSEVSKVHCTECKRMNVTMSEVTKEIKY